MNLRTRSTRITVRISALVETYDPSFREKEAWLDTHGATLIFDGRHL
jgi:hypothetical protein